MARRALGFRQRDPCPYCGREQARLEILSRTNAALLQRIAELEEQLGPSPFAREEPVLELDSVPLDYPSN